MTRAEMRRIARYLTDPETPITLTGAPVAVLNAVMGHIPAGDGACTCQVKTIADESGMCTRTVQRALRTLVDMGILHAEENPGKVTRYVMHPHFLGIVSGHVAPTESHPRQRVTPGTESDEGKNPGATPPVRPSTLASSGGGTQPAEGPTRTRATRTPARPREANPIWDALAAVSLPIENARQRSRFAGVVKRMTAAGYTPDQITEQGERLTREWRRPVCAWQIEDYWQEASNVVAMSTVERFRARHAG